MKELIQRLAEIPAPSGYEGLVRDQIRHEIQAHVDRLEVDPLGNLIAQKGGSPADSPSPRIMITAHMDEIGLIVSHIDAEGFARFVNIGTLQPQTLTGRRVRFLNGATGVIGNERLTTTRETPKIEQLFIDFGVAGLQDCPVQVGDVAAFDERLLDLGGRLAGKSLDDRIGVACLVETIRRLENTPNQLFFVFSAQEEVGARGAGAAAYHIDPAIGLAVDVTSTGDTPQGIRSNVRLGQGPAIKVRDQSMLADPGVIAWLKSTAQKARIPYQIEVLDNGSTDAEAIQLSRSGVPSAGLLVPCRYVHSPSELVDLTDVEYTVNLLVALLSQPVKS